MATKSKKNLIQLHVSQLKLGMFVSELDKSWLETPFAVQGMEIHNQSDIDKISEYAVHVWIDPLKHSPQLIGRLQTLNASNVTTGKRKPELQQKTAPEQNALKRRTYPKTISAAEEHKAASKIYSQGKLGVKKILESVCDNNNFTVGDARSIVNECVESVMRNPDALMWMSKIREQDEYTAEHCLNVCILAMIFGRHLGLTEKELVRLGLCGLLHDLGKMKLPMELLNKTEKLLPEEFDIIKNHAELGYRLLLESEQYIPPIVANVARSHHERIDGLGYPEKKSATELDIMVRMITLVDAYDAMTSDRCYSKGRSNTEALKIIYENKGSQFDEELALEFIKCIGVYPPGIIVELVNGMIGVVIEVNERYRHLPRILVLIDAKGEVADPYIVNLVEIEFGNLNNEHLVKSTHKSGALGIDVSKYLTTFH
jgi:putative nucleotidyltransferase with HDIG domain